MFGDDSFIRRHKIITGLIATPLLIILIGFVWLQSRKIGPHHDYELDLLAPEPATAPPPGQLKVGVAKRDISPNFDDYDPWVDVNDNNKFDPGEDTYEDRNGNGKFDGIWLAGFGTNRPAEGQNDPMWTRAIAFQNNGVTLVMVTIDAIGIFHNEFIDIRKAVDPSLGIDHIMFSSTHSHEVPDTMKIWSFWKRIKWGDDNLDVPGFDYDDRYLRNLQAKTVEAVEEAVRNLQPADMYATKVYIEPEGFVRDSRLPEVMDNHMYLMRFTKPNSDETIATFVNWGNHPEALGGDNTILTSDFPHYLREGVEKGVPEPAGVEGLGGMCLYFQGQVGGLMTQLGIAVPHRDGKRQFKEDSFEKAQAQGENLAIVAVKALRSDAVWKNENPLVAVHAKTFLAPMEGMYSWAIMLGLIHEGYYAGGRAKSELNVLRLGDVTMVAIPGEIYPELVEGGISALPGNEFNLTAPVEVPPMRAEMRNRMAFIIGLANDEIGYILPKSQWDTQEPWTYGKFQYGEGNSGGPELGPLIWSSSMAMLKRMNEAFPPSDEAIMAGMGK